MKIHLPKIPALFINIDKQKKRSHKTDAILKKYFDSVVRIPAFRGFRIPKQSQEHLWIAQAKSFNKAVTQTETPFIVFEDDIEVYKYQEYIEIPDDADAVFLGGSLWGYPEAKYEETHIPGIVKVLNMYTMHSVLFISKELVEEYSKRLLSLEGICDVVFNNIIKEGSYNFYAVNPVMFYQDDPSNPINSKATQVEDYLTRKEFVI